MASLSKIVRTANLFETKSSMLPSVSHKLGLHLSSSCLCNRGDVSSGPTMYDCRKISHHLPTNNLFPKFETLDNMPSGIFRDTSGEILGLGAGKACFYRNPEYFSYHHMSFYDFNMGLRQYRRPSPKTGRKPN